MKQIPLSQGLFSLVDDSDYDFLMQWKWCAARSGKRIYAVRNETVSRKKRQRVYMHRQIIGVTDPKIQVDHREGIGLDNQRKNIRQCVHQENVMNQGVSSSNKSGFKGVCMENGSKKWRAAIKKDGKRIHLGLFSDKIEAAKAYNDAAQKYHGEFAYLNLI